MEGHWTTLITIGGVMLFALGSHFVSKKIAIPQVTLLILAGVAVGPAGFDVLPIVVTDWYPLVSSLALLMVGFVLGRKLSIRDLRQKGRAILWFSVSEVVGAALVIFAGLIAIGVDPVLAMVLAAIGPASAPAAVLAVTEEMEAGGRFTDTLLGIVAIDDAWGLILFSILVAVGGAIIGDFAAGQALTKGAIELFGAFALGICLGWPAAVGIRHMRAGEPMRLEAIGLVLVCGGLALLLDVSFLLSAIVLGATIANVAREDEEPFDAIKSIEWPFLVLFFILSGASLELSALRAIGVVGGAYILLRAAGLMLGAWVGGRLGGADKKESRWMGVAIMPQAGVALGMALIAGEEFPQSRDLILAVVLGSTVVFELVGPVLTRLALVRAGEAR